ncbi:MAG: DUF4292 domain-containing protein [Bacteroides sp.]|jgi:uncharacterized protein YceK|nr:DUF4292 domain-containing protein [Bacteroides sp.]MCI1681343.1 DUF4292 domain-containing protein [Bacteroides sp.]
MNIPLNKNGVAKVLRILPFALALLFIAGLSGCSTSRKMVSSGKGDYLSSKVRLTVPHDDAMITISGTMKLIRNERVQLSFLMPVFRTEVARLDVTPDDVLVVDRMGKRYVHTSREELKGVLPKKADFNHLEKMLFKASKSGKATLTGKELGLTSSLEKGKIELFDFSDKTFSLEPTKVSSKYTEVQWTEIAELLMKL